MRLVDFLKNIQSYYGSSYPEGQQPFIAKYLKAHSERSLDYLLDFTMKSHPTNWGLPDIAAFEKVMPQVTDEVSAARQIEKTKLMLLTDETEEDHREEIADMFADLRSKMEEA